MDTDKKYTCLKSGAIAALAASDLDEKCALTQSLASNWQTHRLSLSSDRKLLPPERPGRPEKPILIAPQKMRKRSIRSEAGMAALLHSIAHIELNAIDLALDIIARFA